MLQISCEELHMKLFTNIFQSGVDHGTTNDTVLR